MSRIIDKVFDAGKKIIRSIFKGSPNLITSADLNRQMEAFKYQLDQLDDKTGMVSDMEITYSLSAGTLKVDYTFSYLKFKGCEFSPSITTLNTNFTKSAPIAYLCLVADRETVTFESDDTHDIAGAKFVDGTSMPAANQIRYIDETIILTHALSNVDNLVGIIAIFTLSESGNVVVKKNIIQDKNSLSMEKGGVVSDFDSSLVGKVTNGKSYDEAFSIIENRFSNISPQWDFLVGTDIAFRLQSGVLYLNLPEQKLQKVVSAAGGALYKLGEFPSDKKNEIISLLRKLDLESYNKFETIPDGTFIPYGEFGCFPYFRPCTMKADSSASMAAYPVFGMAKVSLLLEYSQSDSGNYVLSDVFIGMYVTGVIIFNLSDHKLYDFSGPMVDWTDITPSIGKNYGYVYVPRLIGAIPLFGPS